MQLISMIPDGPENVPDGAISKLAKHTQGRPEMVLDPVEVET